ncbi:MAG TPA: M56 family metallopeptidase [Candidatus Sulfotelmatobacter sp.]
MIDRVRVAFNLHAIAQISALQIVDCLVQGTLIAIFFALMLGMARRQNADTRFAVWFSALMAIATLPLFGSWGRHVGIPAGSASPSTIILPGSWALYLFGTWAVIAAGLLMGIVRGLWHLHVLRKSSVPLRPAALDPRLQRTLERARSKRSVDFCTSDRVQVPTAVGLVKPIILIPRWVMQELSPDELNQILLHELAHFGRWDDWTNLAQKIVKALFFFHPAVWWIEKRVSLEREMACDDAVLAETASPRAYAECLANLAEKTLLHRSIALAQSALGRIRQTSLRVAQILDVNRAPVTARAWKPAVSLVAGFALVCALGISRTPRLIAFADHPAPLIPTFSPKAGMGGISTESPIASVGATNAVLRRQPVRVVPASLRTGANPGGLESTRDSSEGAAVMPSLTAQRGESTIRQPHLRQLHLRQTGVQQADTRQSGVPADVHSAYGQLTNASFIPVGFTETLIVVIEGSEDGLPDQPVYHIQLWRVMVLEPVIGPSGRIPAKQT